MGTSGATKSATAQNDRPDLRPYHHIAAITPSRPPWKDMPPWVILNRNEGSARKLSRL